MNCFRYCLLTGELEYLYDSIFVSVVLLYFSQIKKNNSILFSARNTSFTFLFWCTTFTIITGRSKNRPDRNLKKSKRKNSYTVTTRTGIDRCDVFCFGRNDIPVDFSPSSLFTTD